MVLAGLSRDVRTRILIGNHMSADAPSHAAEMTIARTLVRRREAGPDPTKEESVGNWKTPSTHLREDSVSVSLVPLLAGLQGGSLARSIGSEIS